MADTVLESFLIKLGYQVDQASQKSFTTAIAEGVKGVTEFATALMAMAVGVEEAVRRTAFQMARLEGQAMLSGKSSQELKRLGSTIEGVGGSYEEAINQQVQFNQALLNAPWMRGYAANLLKGHSVDMKGVIEKYHELSRQFGEGSEQMVQFKLQMEQLGVTSWKNAQLADKQWDVYQRLIKAQEEEDQNFQRRWEAASKNALRLQADWVQLGSTIEKYFKTALGGLMGFMADTTEGLQKWLQDHEKEFNTWMDKLEANAKAGDWEAIGEQIGQAVQHGLKYIYDHMDEWLDAGMKVADKFVEGFVRGLFGAEAVRQAKQISDWLNWVTGAGGDSPEAKASRAAGQKVQKQIVAIPPDTGGPTETGAPDDEGGTITFGQGWDWLKHRLGFEHGGIVPSFAEGGVVPINAHAGEMVLPKPISDGLQSFFSGGSSWDESLGDLGHWLGGDTTFAPLMQFSDQAYDKLVDVFEESLMRVFPDGGKPSTTAPAVPTTSSGGAYPQVTPSGPDGPPGDAPGGAGGIPFGTDWKPAADIPTLSEGSVGISHPERNNPGNLRVGGGGPEGWEGQNTQPGAAFESFKTIEQGIRARAITYNSYFKRGLDTIAKMAEASGPGFENNMPAQLAAYKKVLGGEYDKPGGENLPLKYDAETIRRLTTAGISFEHGGGGRELPRGIGQKKIDEVLLQLAKAGPGGGGMVAGAGKGSDPALIDIMTHAFKAALPPDWSARQTSGERSGNPRSGHFGGHASDWQIYGPGGRAIPNEGADTSGMYRKVAVQAYLYAIQKYGPEAATKLGWGGHFGSDITTGGGSADLMHFDWLFRGIRGHIGNAFAEYNEALKMFQTHATQLTETAKTMAPATEAIKYGTGLKTSQATEDKPQQVVDNSTQNVHIHGVTSPHGVTAELEKLGNRSTAYSMHNGRTMVT